MWRRGLTLLVAMWSAATVVALAGTIIKVRPPALQRQCEGDTLVLTVQAEPPLGESGLQYQWFKEGQPLSDGGRISGAQTNSLRIVNVVPADAGVYTVVVITVPSGATEEAQTEVTIAQAVSITQQPTGQTVCVGQQLTLSVQATGTIDGYQWYHDGNIVAGATEATYTTTASTSDAGEWWVVIISPCGNTISERVQVTVNEPPSIAQQPRSVAVCRGATVTLSVQATGTGPLQYQWYQDGNPISGATSATYQFTATQTAQYSVQVSNVCGQVTSEQVTVRVKEPARISQQPSADTVVANLGSRVELQVAATGEPPLTYQWHKDGAPIAGATNPLYVIPNIAQSDEGLYFCVVTNECGSDTSRTVLVKLIGISEPAVLNGVQLWHAEPHPVSAQARVRYVLPEGGWVRLELLDLHGRSVATVYQGVRAAGEHSAVLDAERLNLPAGVYVVQLETAFGIVRQPLVLVR